MRASIAVVLVLLCILPPACRREDPATQAIRHSAAIAKAQADAAVARTRTDAAAAKKILARSDAALVQLEKLAKFDPATEPSLRSARPIADDVRRICELTLEEAYLAAATSSWKARGYRTGRGLALGTFFQGLALAADQAERAGTSPLPDAVRAAAETAVSIDASFTGRPLRPDGRPNWPEIARELRANSLHPPAQIPLMLALVYVVGQRDELALVEIQSSDPATLPADMRGLFHLLRGVIYRVHGLPRLGQQEFDRIAGATASIGGRSGPELQAGVHLILTLVALKEKDLSRADLELSRALKVWPNNPVAVFITGERLLADGQREAAAESLEKAMGGASEWSAKLIARRAQAIRDTKGPPQPLLLDRGLWRDLVFGYVMEAARQNSLAKPLEGWLKAAETIASIIAPSSTTAPARP